MPGYRRGFGRRRGARSLNMVHSLKNGVTQTTSTGTSVTITEIAKAVDNPTTTANTEVKNGCTIKAIWLSLDVCGLAATGVLQMTGFYLFKNSGANLTPPSPFTADNSNEKRFIIREWSAMTMRNQDGNAPYHWEGWIKVPRPHQRMATDDLWQVVFVTDTAAGHAGIKFVYKYYW